MKTRHAVVLIAIGIAVTAMTAIAWAFVSGGSGSGVGSASVTAMAAPTGVAATQPDPATPTLHVSWTAPSPAMPSSATTSYRVEHQQSSVWSYVCGTSATTSITTTSCDDTGLTSGQSYAYRVTAVWNSFHVTSAATSPVTVTVPRPTVTGPAPAALGAGAVAQDVTISGANFLSGATASFGNAGITVNATTYNSSTSVTANISIARSATTGTTSVSVTNAGGTPGSCSSCFTVNSPPAITTVAPAALARGTTHDVVVTGSGFVTGVAATFSNAGVTVNSTTFNSATQVTANVTIGSGATTGAGTLLVSNPDHGVSNAPAFTVDALPTVTTLSLPMMDVGGSATLTFTGTGFQAGASVSIPSSGQLTVGATTVVNATTLTASVSVTAAATLVTRDVTVTNSDFGAATCSGCFTVQGAPTVTSVSPPMGDQGGSQTVTVTGSNFVGAAGGATPTLAVAPATGITVSNVAFVSPTQVTATVAVATGGGITGTKSFTVTNPDTTSAACAGCFAAQAAPTVTSASPNIVDVGGSEIVEISGTNFVGDAGAALAPSVSFGGNGVTVNTVTFVSTTQVNASITVAPGTASGARSIILTNRDNTTVTKTGQFAVNPAPTATSLTLSASAPTNQLGQNASNQPATLTGTNFVGDNSPVKPVAVSVSGTGVTVTSPAWGSKTSATFSLSVSTTATTGPRDVTITNFDSTQATCSGCLVIGAMPTMTSITPNPLGQPATGVPATIAGAHLASGVTVTVSGTRVTTTATTGSGSSVSLSLATTSGALTGSRDVTLTDPDQGTSTCTGCLSVDAAPTLTAASPSALGAGASGVNVTLTGTNFVTGSGLGVTFSKAVTVNSISVVDSTHLTVNVSVPTTTGAGNSTVTLTDGDYGTVTTVSGFVTIDAAPSVSSVRPAAFDQGGTGTVTLNGTGFNNGSGLAATFSGLGVTVNSTTFLSATQVSANITVGATAPTGSRTVSLVNGDFGPASATNAFAVNAAPAISSVSPNLFDQGGVATTVTISGSNFVGATGAPILVPTVTVSNGTGITVGTGTYVSATSMTVPITVSVTAAVGAHDLTLTNPDGTAVTSPNALTVQGAPTLTTVSPAVLGQSSTNVSFTLTGTNFLAGSTVTVSGAGVTAGSPTVAPTQMTVSLTAITSATTGTRTVTVNNPDGTSAACTNCLTIRSAATLASISPTSVHQGANFTLTVSGSNYIAGGSLGLCVCTGGPGTPLSGVTVSAVTVVNTTTITATVAVGAGVPATGYDVVVTNGDGSVISKANALTVAAAAAITTVTPSPILGTTTSVIVNGSGFTSPAAVAFSNPRITAGTVTVTATKITVAVTVAAGVAGTTTVTVTEPDGSTVTSGSINVSAS